MSEFATLATTHFERAHSELPSTGITCKRSLIVTLRISPSAGRQLTESPPPRTRPASATALFTTASSTTAFLAALYTTTPPTTGLSTTVPRTIAFPPLLVFPPTVHHPYIAAPTPSSSTTASLDDVLWAVALRSYALGGSAVVGLKAALRQRQSTSAEEREQGRNFESCLTRWVLPILRRDEEVVALAKRVLQSGVNVRDRELEVDLGVFEWEGKGRKRRGRGGSARGRLNEKVKDGQWNSSNVKGNSSGTKIREQNPPDSSKAKVETGKEKSSLDLTENRAGEESSTSNSEGKGNYPQTFWDVAMKRMEMDKERAGEERAQESSASNSKGKNKAPQTFWDVAMKRMTMEKEKAVEEGGPESVEINAMPPPQAKGKGKAGEESVEKANQPVNKKRKAPLVEKIYASSISKRQRRGTSDIRPQAPPSPIASSSTSTIPTPSHFQASQAPKPTPAPKPSIPPKTPSPHHVFFTPGVQVRCSTAVEERTRVAGFTRTQQAVLATSTPSLSVTPAHGSGRKAVNTHTWTVTYPDGDTSTWEEPKLKPEPRPGKYQNGIETGLGMPREKALMDWKTILNPPVEDEQREVVAEGEGHAISPEVPERQGTRSGKSYLLRLR